MNSAATVSSGWYQIVFAEAQRSPVLPPNPENPSLIPKPLPMPPDGEEMPRIPERSFPLPLLKGSLWLRPLSAFVKDDSPLLSLAKTNVTTRTTSKKRLITSRIYADLSMRDLENQVRQNFPICFRCPIRYNAYGVPMIHSVFIIGLISWTHGSNFFCFSFFVFLLITVYIKVSTPKRELKIGSIRHHSMGHTPNQFKIAKVWVDCAVTDVDTAFVFAFGYIRAR